MSDNIGWKSKEVVENYKKVKDFIVPGRKEILNIIARIATEFKKVDLKILDIGCGHGDVTLDILNLNPESICTLVDYSEEMVTSSTEKFKGNKKINVLKHDLNDGLPESIMNEMVICLSVNLKK
jgi:ubiquinone/menaquinone biosynthesis C-methylase UbiE